MSTLAARLRDRAERKPESVFCTFIRRGSETTITFGDLYARSSAYAAHFEARGIDSGDIVLIVLPHSPHLYYAFAGAMLAGAVPSFMPFPTPKQHTARYWSEHRQLFARIAPASIVTYAEYAATAREKFADSPFAITVADDELLDAEPARMRGFERTGDDVACLQHSSGTTGLKKGVMLTHRAIENQLIAYAASIGIDERDRIASWLPLYHDMGLIANFLMALVRGVPLIALDPFEWALRPRLLLDAIERHAATLCWLPNFSFAHLVNAVRPNQSWNLSSMRAFINCSEPCKPRVFERFAERFGPCGAGAEKLHVCYALAENVFAATQTALGDPPRVIRSERDRGAPTEILSCGRPIEGVRVQIRGTAGETLGDDSIGEIALASPFLFSGYFQRPDLTCEKLRDGWYATGDLGFTNGGELFVSGRTDDTIAVNGRNYYAHEIEASVSEVPGCIPGRCVALSIDDARDGTQRAIVLAETVRGFDDTAVAAAVKAAVAERLGFDLSLVCTLERGTLVKTTSGKISRAANKTLYLSGALSAENLRARSSPGKERAAHRDR